VIPIKSLLLLLLLSTPQACPVLKAEALTDILEVLSLSKSGLSEQKATTLEGIVTYCVPEGTGVGEAILQDKKGWGIYLGQIEASPDIRMGCRIRVEGTTDLGGFSPRLYVRSSRVVDDKVRWPEPLKASFEEFKSGSLDCRFIEMTGRIRAVFTAPEPSVSRGGLILETNGQEIQVRLPAPLADRTKYIASRVRIRGVATAWYTTARQILAPRLWVAGPEHIEIVQAAPSGGPQQADLTTLLTYQPQDASDGWIRLKGVVTGSAPGHGFYLTDGQRALEVKLAGTESPAVGLEVEVEGFVEAGRFGPVLVHAIATPTGQRVVPVALPIDDTRLNQLESMLVHLTGKVERINIERNACEILTRYKSWPLKATLPESVPDPWPGLKPGAEVQLTGIAQLEFGEGENYLRRPGVRGVNLILRSPADLRVVKPAPWWDQTRLIQASLALAIAAVASTLIIFLRARLQRREAAMARDRSESRFAAILTERNRMARELHDTLAQGLTAVSAQVEAARQVVGLQAPAAAPFLQQARDALRATLAEARASVWEMRSQMLEQYELEGALRRIAEQLIPADTVRFSLEVEGQTRPLPTGVENALLRIGQEALSNALRHGRPTSIQMVLKYLPNGIELITHDDGVGFDTTLPPPSSTLHSGFGLIGMKERATLLGGSLKLSSQADQGAEVTVTLPT
jgi:signal transduction histidine kinase